VNSLYAIARPSVGLSSVCLSVVCLSSVTFVRPTQAVQIFGDIFTAFRYLSHPLTSTENFRGTPPPEELNTRGIAKYSDFGPIDGHISETVQDRR